MEYSVTIAGETATFNVGAATPPLPDMPTVDLASLAPAPGEHLGDILARLKSFQRVRLPQGTFWIIDDAMTNNYSIYAPNNTGWAGAGEDQTILRVKANSYTRKAARPKQAGAGLRIGPNGGASGVARTISDLTIIGAPQAGDDGLPMFTGGYINYYGRGEVWRNVKVKGLNYGGGNSPSTGETFAINMFHDVDSRFYNVEVDGRDETGKMVTASPIGFNNSINSYLENCSFHHTLFSGPTWSYAGTTASPSRTVTTKKIRVEQCANHPNVGSGGRFSGLNHEHVMGKILHDNPDIILDQPGLWDSNHISLGTNLADNKEVEIRNPNWHGLSPKWANGAFVVSMWGNQVTPPAVKNSDGSLKQAVIVKGQNPVWQNINPLTQYACIVGTGYVAP